jgi:hypothetical protein
MDLKKVYVDKLAFISFLAGAVYGFMGSLGIFFKYLMDIKYFIDIYSVTDILSFPAKDTFLLFLMFSAFFVGPITGEGAIFIAIFLNILFWAIILELIISNVRGLFYWIDGKISKK